MNVFCEVNQGKIAPRGFKVVQKFEFPGGTVDGVYLFSTHMVIEDAVVVGERGVMLILVLCSGLYESYGWKLGHQIRRVSHTISLIIIFIHKDEVGKGPARADSTWKRCMYWLRMVVAYCPEGRGGWLTTTSGYGELLDRSREILLKETLTMR